MIAYDDREINLISDGSFFVWSIVDAEDRNRSWQLACQDAVSYDKLWMNKSAPCTTVEEGLSRDGLVSHEQRNMNGVMICFG